MSLAEDFKKAAAGHGRGCICDACLAEQNSRGHYGFDKVLFTRILVGAVLFIAALVLTNILPLLSQGLAVAAVLIAGYDVFVRTGAACVRDKLPDEDMLMCVAVLAAILIGRAREGALLILLLQTAVLIRGYAVEKVRRSVASAADGVSVRPEDARRSGAEEFIRHFSHVYTPIILGMAVLFAVLLPLVFHTTVTEAVGKALILLFIACPCSFVLSIPLAFRTGTGGAARHGVLFRSDWAMEEMCRVGTVVFDKNGALEGEGQRVISVKSDRMDAETLLRIAAHACAYSQEPLAESIKSAYQDTIYIELIQSFHEEPGKGIAVEVDGVGILLGSEEFIRSRGVDPGLDAVPESSVYLAIDGQYAGRILFGPVARDGGSRAVQYLSWDNERQVLLLSEDTPSATEKFARSVGIGQYYSDCAGDKKAAVVRDLNQRKTKRGSLLLAGGVQTEDEAFAEADLRAILDAGGDPASVDRADVAVTGPSPFALVTAIDAARRTRTIVRQNVLFALAFKIVVLLLDVFSVCPLWLAVFADSGVTLAVVLNCLRAMILREDIAPGE